MNLFDCEEPIWNNTWTSMLDSMYKSTEISVWVFSPARKTVESCIWSSIAASIETTVPEIINEMNKDE